MNFQSPRQTTQQTIQYIFGETFFAELANGGVRHMVLSPGSRSAPIALTSAPLQQIVVTDERSAAFVAQGLARASKTPVALACTSGTATANYLPAVAEASNSGVSLIVITADRPLHSRDWGDNQTIDQQNLYGGHVRWFTDIEVSSSLASSHTPADFAKTAAFAKATARRSIAMSQGGPVHINWHLSEPLEPPDTNNN